MISLTKYRVRERPPKDQRSTLPVPPKIIMGIRDNLKGVLASDEISYAL
jgi:hypothetical protein